VGIAAGFLLLRLWESRGLVGGYDAAVYWQGAHAFVRGGDPYAIDTFVVPPTALPLIAAIGWLPFRVAYLLLQLVAATAMTAALALLGRSVGLTNRGALLGSLLAVAWSSGTFETYGFGNLNGVILLCEALVILASLGGDERRVGLWFGLSLAVKPVLAPFGLMLLCQRRWRAAAWSTVPPVVTLAMAIALGGGTGFLRRAVPGLLDSFNHRFLKSDVSLRGLGEREHLPSALVTSLRVVLVIACTWAALVVWRAARPTTWWDRRTVVLVELGSVLLIGTFLAAPFGWRYYSVFLLPWLVHVLATHRPHPPPVLHVLAWSLLLLPDSLGLRFDQGGAPTLNRERPTLALLLLLIAAFLDARRGGARAPDQPARPAAWLSSEAKREVSSDPPLI
ncbi:MAG: arabinofuranan 3-O-arabinosyltransferase, partial [Actinomycetota bacterium]|nr:arabinofuranan 3-O-arabinosyltransferase [Actinomycetota bacterium]